MAIVLDTWRVKREDARRLRSAWRKRRRHATTELGSNRIIHRSKDVAAIFARHHLSLEDVVIVDEEQRWFGVIRMPMKVFLLRKT